MFLGRADEELTTAEWITVLGQLSQAGTIAVGFLGGEPFMRRDLLEIIAFARRLGLQTFVTTNGYFVNQERAAYLLNELECNISFSFDGPEHASHDFVRGVGSFDRTSLALRTCLKVRKPESTSQVGLSFVVHRQNQTFAEKFIDFAVEGNVDFASIAEVHDGGRAISNWSDLKMSKEDLLDCCVRLGQRIHQVRHGDKPYFRMDFFTSVVRQFLREVHGVDYEQEMRLDPAGISECYIQHNGLVFPSQQA